MEPDRSSRFERILGRYGGLLRYSSSSIILQMANLGCSVVVLRWLSPSEMGLWQSLILIQTYSALIQAGVFNGLSRELPFSIGAGHTGQAERLASTAQGVAMLAALALTLGIVPAFCLAGNSAARFYAIAALLTSAAQLYRNYLGVTYRSSQAFETLSRINLVEAGLTLVTLPAVYYLKLHGYAARFALLAVSMTLFNHCLRPLRVKTHLEWRALHSLLKTGLPIFAFGYLLTVCDTFPRLILLSGGGIELVGLFAPAAVMIGIFRTLPTSLAMYIYPQMSIRFGQSGDPRSLRSIAFKSAFAILGASVPPAILLVLVAPPVVAHFFPSYDECSGAIQWTILAGVFMGASVAVNALYSLKAFGWMAVYTCSRLCFSFVGPWSAFQVGTSLTSLAAGLAVSEGISFAIALWAIYSATAPRVGRPEQPIEPASLPAHFT